jgi:4-amino-4-deoxy-L-arabinose transferase-like glycosyltransferase
VGQVAPARNGAALGLIAGACAVFAIFVWATGGISTTVAGIAVRSRSWERPAALAAVVGALALYRGRTAIRAGVPRAFAALGGLGWIVPALAVAWTLTASLWFGTHAAGGADSYGYVSQAELLARGRLTDAMPLNAAFDWPDAPYTLTPLAYARNAHPGELAPIYPPGLSLMMAPLVWIDPRAVFLLVPLCAALAVWLCVRLGRELGDRDAGTLGALLLAFSPTFLLQSIQPMSDVPVTALWLAALLLARRAASGPVLAGAVASLAIMVRPNLAPLAALVATAAIRLENADAAGGHRWRASLLRVAACVGAMLPGVAALGWIQSVRYGSPLSSGYGSFGELFALANIQPNLQRYPRWLTAAHTPFIWAWLLAPLAFAAASRQVRVFSWILYAFIASVVLAYLPYVYFRPDEWSYTRFLLPALPMMLVLGAAVLLALLRRMLPRAGRVLAAVPACALAAWCLYAAIDRGVFRLWQEERKYPRVGTFVRDQLPATAFVMAAQHSGSVRYYSRRPTMRWDVLDRAALDRAIGSLRKAGFEPFVVLDAGEDEEFRRKFRSTNQQAVQTMMPVVKIGNTSVYAFR